MLRLLQRIYNSPNFQQQQQSSQLQESSSNADVIAEIGSLICDGTMRSEEEYGQILISVYENMQSVEVIMDMLYELLCTDSYAAHPEAVCSWAEATYYLLCEIFWSNTAEEIQHSSHISAVMQLFTLMETRYTVVGDFPFALLRALVYTEEGTLALIQASIPAQDQDAAGDITSSDTPLTVLYELLNVKAGDNGADGAGLQRDLDEDDLTITVLILHRMVCHRNNEITLRLLELGLAPTVIYILDTFVGALGTQDRVSGEGDADLCSSNLEGVYASDGEQNYEVSTNDIMWRRNPWKRDCMEMDDMSCLQLLLECICLICRNPDWRSFMSGFRKRLGQVVKLLLNHYGNLDGSFIPEDLRPYFAQDSPSSSKHKPSQTTQVSSSRHLSIHEESSFEEDLSGILSHLSDLQRDLTVHDECPEVCLGKNLMALDRVVLSLQSPSSPNGHCNSQTGGAVVCGALQQDAVIPCCTSDISPGGNGVSGLAANGTDQENCQDQFSGSNISDAVVEGGAEGSSWVHVDEKQCERSAGGSYAVSVNRLRTVNDDEWGDDVEIVPVGLCSTPTHLDQCGVHTAITSHIIEVMFSLQTLRGCLQDVSVKSDVVLRLYELLTFYGDDAFVVKCILAYCHAEIVTSGITKHVCSLSHASKHALVFALKEHLDSIDKPSLCPSACMTEMPSPQTLCALSTLDLQVIEICHALSRLPEYEVYMICDAYIHFLTVNIYLWDMWMPTSPSSSLLSSSDSGDVSGMRACSSLCGLVRKSLHAAARANRYGIATALATALERHIYDNHSNGVAWEDGSSMGKSPRSATSRGLGEGIAGQDVGRDISADVAENIETLLQLMLLFVQWDDVVINTSLCAACMPVMCSLINYSREDSHVVTMVMHLWECFTHQARSVLPTTANLKGDMLQCVISVCDLHLSHRALLVLSLSVVDNIFSCTATLPAHSSPASYGHTAVCAADIQESLMRLLLRIERKYHLDPLLTQLSIANLTHTVSFTTACTLMWLGVVPITYDIMVAFDDDHAMLLSCLQLLVKITSLSVALVEVLAVNGTDDGLHILVRMLRKCCSLRSREEFQDVQVEVLRVLYNAFAMECCRSLLLQHEDMSSMPPATTSATSRRCTPTAAVAGSRARSDSLLSALVQSLQLTTAVDVMVLCLQVLCRLAASDDIAVRITKMASGAVLDLMCDVLSYYDSALESSAAKHSSQPEKEERTMIASITNRGAASQASTQTGRITAAVSGEATDVNSHGLHWDSSTAAVLRETLLLIHRLSLVHTNAVFLGTGTIGCPEVGGGGSGDCVGTVLTVLSCACDILKKYAEWVEEEYGQTCTDCTEDGEEDGYQLVSSSCSNSDTEECQKALSGSSRREHVMSLLASLLSPDFFIAVTYGVKVMDNIFSHDTVVLRDCEAAKSIAEIGSLLRRLQSHLEIIANAPTPPSSAHDQRSEASALQHLVYLCHHHSLSDLLCEVTRAGHSLSSPSGMFSSPHHTGSSPPRPCLGVLPGCSLSASQKQRLLCEGVTLTEYIRGVPFLCKMQVKSPLADSDGTDKESPTSVGQVLHLCRIGQIYVPRVRDKGTRQPATVIALSSVHDDVDSNCSAQILTPAKGSVENAEVSSSDGVSSSISVPKQVALPLSVIEKIELDGEGCAQCPQFYRTGATPITAVTSPRGALRVCMFVAPSTNRRTHHGGSLLAGSLPRDVSVDAASYAFEFADMTSKMEWTDALVELHATITQPEQS